jgi:hypothetical protein
MERMYRPPSPETSQPASYDVMRQLQEVTTHGWQAYQEVDASPPREEQEWGEHSQLYQTFDALQLQEADYAHPSTSESSQHGYTLQELEEYILQDPMQEVIAYIRKHGGLSSEEVQELHNIAQEMFPNASAEEGSPHYSLRYETLFSRINSISADELSRRNNELVEQYEQEDQAWEEAEASTGVEPSQHGYTEEAEASTGVEPSQHGYSLQQLEQYLIHKSYQEAITHIRSNGGLSSEEVQALRNTAQNMFPGKSARRDSKKFDSKYETIYKRILNLRSADIQRQNDKYQQNRQERQERRQAWEEAEASIAPEPSQHGYSFEELVEHLVHEPNRDVINNVRELGGLSSEEVQALRSKLRERFAGASTTRGKPNYSPEFSSMYNGIGHLSQDALRKEAERKEASRKKAERKETERKQSKRRKG